MSDTTDNPTNAERRALVLQGGGALGAYQAGVYEALHAQGLEPQWVAGISIGAINAALIAGNPPERRVQRLHDFWDGVSANLQAPAPDPVFGVPMRALFNESSAAMVAAFGVPGFFNPRFPPANLQVPGTPGALSLYDTAPLEKTLDKLVDFDLINSTDPRHRVRLSVGAVNVTSGNFVYFDSDGWGEATPKSGRKQRITARHIMASGALPPGFAPIEIDGDFYWDGGIVSNTPLQYLLDQPKQDDMLIMQVDLFSARGAMPTNLDQVSSREKDIRFASRTRLNTDVLAQQQRLAHSAKRLADKLPAKFADDPDLKALLEVGSPAAISILHFINRNQAYEEQSKDYEFSRATVQEHWANGVADVTHSLNDPRWRNRKRPSGGIHIYDLTPQL